MIELLNSYRNDAWPFALVHLMLCILCTWHLLRLRIDLSIERSALTRIQMNPNSLLTGSGDQTSNTERLVHHVGMLSAKGRMVEPEAIARSMSRRFADREAVVRFCVNGFIVVGLMGTLFNFWQFGPEFWRSLVDSASTQSEHGIGIAFAASLFGIGLALVFNFVEVLAVRRPRDLLVRDASTLLGNWSAESMPPTQESLIQQALTDFSKTSQSMLRGLQSEQARITQELSDQVRQSSQVLDLRLSSISDDLQTYLTDASSKIDQGSQRMASAATKLATSADQAGSTLAAVTETLESYKGLSDFVAQVREESVRLVTQVTQQLSQFSCDVRLTLTDVVAAQAETSRAESEQANRRLSDLVDTWHTKSASTLSQFGHSLEKVSDSLQENWQEIVVSLGEQTSGLLRDWSSLLNQGTVSTRESLQAVNEQIRIVDSSLSSVTTSGKAIATSVDEMQSAVAELTTTLHQLSEPDVMKRGQPIVVSSDVGQMETLLRELIKQVENLPDSSAQSLAKVIVRETPSLGASPEAKRSADASETAQLMKAVDTLTQSLVILPQKISSELASSMKTSSHASGSPTVHGTLVHAHDRGLSGFVRRLWRE